MAIASVAFVGCSDDKKEANAELVGTRWMYEEGHLGDANYWAEGVKFETPTEFTYFYYEMDDKLNITDEGESVGKYEYNPPIVTGTISMDGVKVMMRGEITDNNMLVYIDNEKYATYKKQRQ